MTGLAVDAGATRAAGWPSWPLWTALSGLVLAAGTLAGGDSGYARIGVLLVAAPLLEEAVFRCGAQEALLRRGMAPHLSVWLTALLFGLAHVLLRGEAQAFAVAAPALLIGTVYARWRWLLPCVLLHAAMNAAWVMWRLTGPAPPGFQ